MNTCKTCKHWKTESWYVHSEEEGECLLADNGGRGEELFWISWWECNEVALVTKENFGCVAWKGK